MGWASFHIAKLKAGETVKFRPRGNSMSGRIESGNMVTVVPITKSTEIGVGDIVLCSVGGRQFLHLVKGCVGGVQFLIGNNRGGTNGWTSRGQIFGKLVAVEP